MATLSVLYPRTAGARFDYDYYQTRHLPLAVQRWGDAGLTGGEALLGTSAGRWVGGAVLRIPEVVVTRSESDVTSVGFSYADPLAGARHLST